MSVKLMSAIFETEFRDLEDDGGNVTKASTAKLVLLAMADHANDEGEGAYPSVDRLARKTALSEQTIRNTFDALKHNGIIFLVGVSKYRTNNYTINTGSFPRLMGQEDGVLLIPNWLEGQMSTVEGANELPLTPHPLDPNHQLTVQEPSPRKPIEFHNAMWDLQHGELPSPESLEAEKSAEVYTSIAERLEVGLRRGQFPQSPKAQAVYKWIAKREAAGQSLNAFIAWAMRDERAAQNSWIYHKDPEAIKRDWLQVYPKGSKQQQGSSFYG